MEKRKVLITTIIISILNKNTNIINHQKKSKEKIIEKINKSNLNTTEKESKIKEIKRLPFYEKGKGLPIGNMSSQIMAVLYLNKLDHFIKEKLHIKQYIRYMDDGILISNDKEYLKHCLKLIEQELKKYKRKLKLNNKTQIVNVNKEGIDFLGFHFYIRRKVIMKVRNDCKRHFKRKLKIINKYKPPKSTYISIIKSYEGHFKWGNCYNLYKDNIKKYRNTQIINHLSI